jgi:predicted PurR-regulated permease PerM
VYIQSRADSDDVNSMMAMVMIAMMIVLVMVIIVPEALNQVDSVRQHLCKTFQKLIEFLWPNASRPPTPHDVCISQMQLSSLALLCSH